MGFDPLGIGISVLQAGTGLVQAISGNSKVNKLTKSLKPFEIPSQINQILDLALGNAGGDTQTRDFQTNQLDNSFAGVLDTAQKLNADPNDLSALFDKKINGLLQIGNQFHASNLESMGRVFNALNLKADNEAAVQKSRNDLLKDQIAAAQGQKASGFSNISGGLSTGLAAVTANRAGNLYGTGSTTTRGSNILGSNQLGGFSTD